MTIKKRVADLQPGDLTTHAGGSCVCHDPCAPWRVEKLETWPGASGIDVTWSHPPCGEVAPPLACSSGCPVTFYGRA